MSKPVCSRYLSSVANIYQTVPYGPDGEKTSQGQEGPTSAMSSALKDIHETEHVKDNLLQEQQVLQGQLDCCEFSGRWLIVV